MKSFKLFSELHPAQPVAAQQVHPGAERGDGQVVLVDDQPGRQDRRQVLPPPGIQSRVRYIQNATATFVKV